MDKTRGCLGDWIQDLESKSTHLDFTWNTKMFSRQHPCPIVTDSFNLITHHWTSQFFFSFCSEQNAVKTNASLKRSPLPVPSSSKLKIITCNTYSVPSHSCICLENSISGRQTLSRNPSKELFPNNRQVSCTNSSAYLKYRES